MAVPAATVPFSIPQEVAIRIYAACKGVGTKENELIAAITSVDDFTVRFKPLTVYAGRFLSFQVELFAFLRCCRSEFSLLENLLFCQVALDSGSARTAPVAFFGARREILPGTLS